MDRPQGQSERQMRAVLGDAHGRLLGLHKALLDHERGRYEKIYGPIPNAGAALQLVIDDPWFGWLKPLSTLITRIDELLSGDEALDPQEGQAVLRELRLLLTPDETGAPFQREYFRAIQESADIAYLHGQWKQQVRGGTA